ncbi:hypothetical protein HBB16_00870 [Pseudonocardia sp. MCCB 268]|nr:hypothetical protein [Pseudonocardia cytotoxica]
MHDHRADDRTGGPESAFGVPQALGRQRLAVLTAAVLGLIVVVALLAPWITPQDPNAQTLMDRCRARLPPPARCGRPRLTCCPGWSSPPRRQGRGAGHGREPRIAKVVLDDFR